MSTDSVTGPQPEPESTAPGGQDASTSPDGSAALTAAASPSDAEATVPVDTATFSDESLDRGQQQAQAVPPQQQPPMPQPPTQPLPPAQPLPGAQQPYQASFQPHQQGQQAKPPSGQPAQAPQQHVPAAQPPRKPRPRTSPIVWGALILVFCAYVVVRTAGGAVDVTSWLITTIIGLGALLLAVGIAVLVRGSGERR